MSRAKTITRTTKETDITVTLDLDASAQREIATGVPFFDHLLDAMSYHGGFDLMVKATGDTQVDPHHLVEDVGIVLGQAFAALSDRITRFGHAVIPMDEAIAEAAIDVCGRPTLVYCADYRQPYAGAFDLSLIREFLLALAANAKLALHLHARYGENGHHMAEAAFKALGKALSAAYAGSGSDEPRSTKGVI